MVKTRFDFLVFESLEVTDNLPFEQYRHWIEIKAKESKVERRKSNLQFYVAAGVMVMIAYVFVSNGQVVVRSRLLDLYRFKVFFITNLKEKYG